MNVNRHIGNIMQANKNKNQNLSAYREFRVDMRPMNRDIHPLEVK